jgi:cysteine synthase
MGDVLSLSPILMERYLAAAENIMQRAILVDIPKIPNHHQSAKNLEPAGRNVPQTRFRPLTGGNLNTPFRLGLDGDYVLRTRVYGSNGGEEGIKAAWLVDGKQIATFDVPKTATEKQPATIEHKLQLEPGEHRFAVTLLNPTVIDPKQVEAEMKRAAAEAYGATIDQEAAGPHEVFDRLAELQAQSARALVHPFDDPLVMAGQGTVGLEICEDLPDVDVVVVPVGGGGLVAGIATALPGRRIVAVEPERAAALREALAAGEPVKIRPDSVADGLNAPFAGAHPLAVCLEAGVESVLVTENEIEDGFRFLYERAKLAAEPAGAAGVAALLAGKVPDVGGRTVAIVVSGGNVAAQTAAAILSSNEA